MYVVINWKRVRNIGNINKITRILFVTSETNSPWKRFSTTQKQTRRGQCQSSQFHTLQGCLNRELRAIKEFICFWVYPKLIVLIFKIGTAQYEMSRKSLMAACWSESAREWLWQLWVKFVCKCLMSCAVNMAISFAIAVQFELLLLQSVLRRIWEKTVAVWQMACLRRFPQLISSAEPRSTKMFSSDFNKWRTHPISSASNALKIGKFLLKSIWKSWLLASESSISSMIWSGWRRLEILFCILRRLW